jgi:hypothetical protein
MSNQIPNDVPNLHYESWARLSEYAARNGKTLDAPLGWGNEGLVYSTTMKTAIKSYRHANLFENERNVYLRLQDRQVLFVRQFAVPQLVSFDNSLNVLEMSIVSPPFILDFAGAYLDRKPPFDEEQWADWEQEKKEQFEDRWPEVDLAISSFKRFGIHLNDIKPGNVEFAD